MRYDDGLFICKLGEKLWSSCLYRWKVSIVSVLLFLLLPLLTSYRQNYYLVMGEPTLLRNYRETSTQSSTQNCDQKCNSTTYQIPYSQAAQTNCTETLNSKCPLCQELNNYTIDDISDCICQHIPIKDRTNYEIKLKFCNWRTLTHTIILDANRTSPETYPYTKNSTCLQMTDEQSCRSCIKDIMDRDDELMKRALEHSSKLKRYDCDRKYSMWAGPVCEKCTVGRFMPILFTAQFM